MAREPTPADRVCHAGAAAVGNPSVAAWAPQWLGSELVDHVVSDPIDVLAWDEVVDDHHVCVFAAAADPCPGIRARCAEQGADSRGQRVFELYETGSMKRTERSVVLIL